MKKRLWSARIVVALLSWGCAQDPAGPTSRRSAPQQNDGPRSSTSGPTYTNLDVPGGVLTLAADVNKTGQIVGRYTDSTGIIRGFLRSGTSYTSITFPPDALWTRAISINNGGTIVGDYSLSDSRGDKNVHAYVLQNNKFSSFDFPGAAGTVAEGIDTNGEIVGFYTLNDGSNTGTGSNNRHGFLLSNGVFTSIDYPGAGSTEAWRINDQHVILGRYKGTTDAKWHLYLLSADIFTPVADFPGFAEIAPDGYAHVGGLNLRGDIVSSYCLASCNNPATAVLHGYLLSGGAYTTIDPARSALHDGFRHQQQR